MRTCESCGQEFQPMSAREDRSRHIIMLIWALRRTNCPECLLMMQKEWNEARWAARQEIATVR